MTDIAVATFKEKEGEGTVLEFATESANLVFVTFIDHTAEDPFEYLFFEVVPAVSAVANLGTVQAIAVHGGSTRIFGVNSGKLVAAFPEDEEVGIVAEQAGFTAMQIVGDGMVALAGNGIMTIDIDEEGEMDGERGIVGLTLPSSASEAYKDVVYAGFYTSRTVSSTSGQPRGFILYSDDSGDTCFLVEVDELINVTDLLLDYNE